MTLAVSNVHCDKSSKIDGMAWGQMMIRVYQNATMLSMTKIIIFVDSRAIYFLGSAEVASNICNDPSGVF